MITTLVEPLGNKLIDVRDCALLLIGFAGALRRSELVALDVDDISEDADGLVLIIRRSKTDQEAEGETRDLPYGSHPATCPVRAWRAWADASSIDTGPAFRGVDRHGRMRSTRLSDRAVADMIKRRGSAAALDGLFAGHSLRSGFATEAYAQGAAELAIMRHGRWKSATCEATSKKAPSGPTTPLPDSDFSYEPIAHSADVCLGADKATSMGQTANLLTAHVR